MKENKKTFLRIPNKVFYSNKEGEDSLLKQSNFNDKLLYSLCYLEGNTTRLGTIGFTLLDMINCCGLKPNRAKGKTNEQFKNALKLIQNQKIISKSFDIEAMKINNFIKCDNSFDLSEGFFTLELDLVDKILSLEEKNVDNLQLLTYYAYLVCRTYTNSNEINISRDGGRSETCFLSYDKISQDINLSSKTIKKYNDILYKIKMVYIGNAGIYQLRGSKSIIKQSPNVYTIIKNNDLDSAKDMIKRGIIEYKTAMKLKGYAFVNNNYNNTNRKTYGFINRIEQLERQGKATSEQIEKKVQLQQSIQLTKTKGEEINNGSLKELSKNYWGDNFYNEE